MKVIKACENGSFFIQKDCLDVEPDKGGGLLFELCSSIELDFEPPVEPENMGNFDVCYTLYNAKTQLSYIVSGQDIRNYEKGAAIWLRGIQTSESEEICRYNA